jgi:lipid II:glycine glycyltransferase (peptidoglycan interpeptide bridge formation enzyme)
MFTFKKKFLFFHVGETWYTFKTSFTDLLLPNSYRHIKKYSTPVRGCVAGTSYTIENDLTLDKEQILAGYTKSVRQQITQAKDKGVICYFNNDVDSFVDFYNDFANRLGIAPTSRRRILELGNDIKISFASLDGKILTAHLVIMDRENKIVMVSHSSSKRNDETYDKHIIGKANKYLHCFEMMHFKDEGFLIYDFGGYTKDPTDPGLAGINSFKLQFGGAVTECRDYYTYPFIFLRKIGKMMGALGRG